MADNTIYRAAITDKNHYASLQCTENYSAIETERIMNIESCG